MDKFINNIDLIQEEVLTVVRTSLHDRNMIEIDYYSNLSNLEIDSLDFIKIVILLEEHFKIEFEDDKILFTEFNNIKSISDYVYRKVSELKI